MFRAPLHKSPRLPRQNELHLPVLCASSQETARLLCMVVRLIVWELSYVPALHLILTNAVTLEIRFSPDHLKYIMALDASHRLPQTSRPTMTVIRLRCIMFMENDTFPFSHVLRIMYVPDMSCVLRLDFHIIVFRQNNIEVGLVKIL